MAINKRQLGIVLVASLVLQTGVGAAIMGGGTAVAVPTAGVGGFHVKFDKLQGHGFKQYATVENTSKCSAYPSAVANIQSGTISGLTLYKDIKLPGGNTIRMTMHSNKKVHFTGLKQKFTYLKGNLQFSNQSIKSGVGGKPKNAISLSAPSLTIKDGRIYAQSQFVQRITLNGMRVHTEVNPPQNSTTPPNQCISGGSSSS